MELKEKYDLLIHIVKESGLTKAKQLEGIVGLFPKFNPKMTRNDQFLTSYVLEMYAYSRSLGLSAGDAANSARISATLINMMLEGSGLSLNKFMDLVEAEMYAGSEMKRKHLAKLDTASDTDVTSKASIAFLEKIYPKQYGPKATVIHDVDDDVKKVWEVQVQHVEPKSKKELPQKQRSNCEP